jgi:FkbM family methyltransferase
MLLKRFLMMIIDGIDIKSTDFVDTENPYLELGNMIKWLSLDHEFIQHNTANFDHDYEIKDDIIKRAVDLPLNSGIIDSGAHTGDGSFPIAHALAKLGREDIIIYAIEPFAYKCEFMKMVLEQNDIVNIRIINVGLSDIETIYGPDKTKEVPPGSWDTNSGGTCWSSGIDSEKSLKFTTIDNLVKSGQIEHQIKMIQLDVQFMEAPALRGGANLLEKNSPYLSLEDNWRSGNPNIYLDSVPSGYEFKKYLNRNVVYERMKKKKKMHLYLNQENIEL